MNKTFSLALLYALVFPCLSFAQEYSYTHYGIPDGLAGATVYCLTQDKDGFIWAGTETGVSRFDGTHFQNFTTTDGLPDLEILHLFGDSKGRVWMAPLRKAVCYYYKGKVYNEQNDPTLARMRLRGIILGFAEDATGNILIHERDVLHQVNADGSLVEYDSLDNIPIRECRGVSASPAGHFLVAANGRIMELAGKKIIRSMPGPGMGVYPRYIPYIEMTKAGAIWNIWSGGYTIRLFQRKDSSMRSLARKHPGMVSVSLLDDSLVYTNELSGSYEYNIHTGKTKHYLPGVPVSRVFRDASGDLWFTTLGEGIFKLSSHYFRIINSTVEPGEKTVVTAINRLGNELWVGNNHNCLFRYSLPDLRLINRKPVPELMARRILYIDTTADGLFLAGGDNGLYTFTPSGRLTRVSSEGLKSAVRIGDRKLLIALHSGGGILDLANPRPMKMLLLERTTVAFCSKDTLYIGGLNGLYRWGKDGSRVFLGERNPFLRKRISALAESPDGILWVGSADAGVIGYKDDRQVAVLTRQQGLTSDICRCLQVRNNALWVGTDKGLNRVDLAQPGYRVTQYTARDGLASDQINTVFIDQSRIYVGTPTGLCYFDERQPVNPEACRLYLLSVTNAERDRIADTANLVIPWTDKRIRFTFSGLSLRSGGDIVYRYRLLGLDDRWRETKDNFLEYPDLPSGNYEWQLIAVNKFGNESRMLTVPITVTTQWWKRTGFLVGAWLLSFFCLWLLVSLRIRRIRRRQREKDELRQRMSELETTALKSQMNPHFIFNCLTSIQKFIFNGEIALSNKYITGLAKLIRVTLINSSRNFVSVGEEVEYLSSYLSLEKMRFKEKIDFDITVDAGIDRAAVLIPPMLIQPYVENALVHGLGDGRSGFLRVKMEKADGRLVVTVEDNGIGRQAAAEKRIIRVTGDSSKGMSLTEDRIAILNGLYEGGASQEIVDLVDEEGRAAGTRVVIRLPLFGE